MAAERGNIESLKRAGRTILFMVVMVGSLLGSSLLLLVSIADIAIPCAVLSTFTCCTSCLSFRLDWATYSFRTSLADIPLLSLARSLAAICAYSVCGVPSLCHGPYLGVTVVSGVATAVFLSAKALLYRVSHVTHATPVAEVNVYHHTWILPVLLTLSAVFSLVHIVVAYKLRCQARRKLCFHRTDSESITANGYQRIPRGSSPSLFGKNDLESNTGGQFKHDDDNDVPARMLADLDSIFMECKGLLLHYKSIEGSFKPNDALLGTFAGHDQYQSFKLLTSNVSVQPFPTTWNPLAKMPTNGSINTNIHTPLLSSSAVDLNFASSFSSSTGSINSLRLNGWPAIVQQMSNQEMAGGMSELPARPSKPGQGECKLSQKSVYEKGTGVVLLHGFGGGVFSWRHVMGAVARQVGCRVVAFDRPGWGLTSRPRRSEWEQKGLLNPYDLHTQVDLFFAFCQELGLTSVVLVGHADGGLLALMAAARALKSKDSIQVEVKGLVLIGVSLSREVVPPFARALLHMSLGRHMLRSLLRSEIGQVTTRRAWHDASKLTSETLDLYKAPLHVEGWEKSLAEVSKASMTSSILTSTSAAELVRCVANLPALVVAGVQDRLVPLKTAQSLTSQLPLSRLVAIPGCGHLPHEECPAAVLSAMFPFVSALLIDE